MPAKGQTKAISPADRAKSGTEHGHQSALFVWAQQNRAQYPELDLLFAIPNGGARANNRRDAAIRGARLRAEGVKAGVPDLLLPVARHGVHGLFIEMKRPKSPRGRAGTLTGETQSPWIDSLRAQGYGAAVCVGWEAARDVLLLYLK